MEIHRPQLKEICRLVREVARRELLPRFERVAASRKPDGSLLTAADLAVQQGIARELHARWPDVPLLGEEMDADRQQTLLNASDTGIWCLDPLDGTANYAAGIPFFSVSLAYIAGGTVHMGLVLDPMRDECFSALRGQAAWLNDDALGAPRPVETLGEAMALVDLKRLPASVVEAIGRRPPYRSQRSFGSVALDWCWLAASRCQVYVHGGQRLWDYAAGQLIFAESGGIGGLSADYRFEPETRLSLSPKVATAAADAQLLARWRDWIAAHL